jgi:TPR repeat protein
VLSVAPVAAGPFEDGLDAASRGDYATAILLWRPLADQGNAIVQTMLGTMYTGTKGTAPLARLPFSLRGARTARFPSSATKQGTAPESSSLAAARRATVPA